MDQLMLFRTTYLRSIAEAWANPAFHDALLADPVKAMRVYFGFSWPWSTVCKLTVIEDRTKLRWIEDRWVWSRNGSEGLTLNVPLSAPSAHPAQQSRALADWYRQYASLFGNDWGARYGHERLSAAHPVGITAPDVGAGSPAPDGGYMPSSQDLASFRIVLLAAIAKAWRDVHFRDKLQLDAKTALSEIRNYVLPWDLGIYLHDDPRATWQGPGAGDPPSQHQSYWHNQTPHVLTLYLPSKPDTSELACEPIALAMYNAAGAEYPFTCCCAP